jgi:hypothetical protein
MEDSTAAQPSEQDTDSAVPSNRVRPLAAHPRRRVRRAQDGLLVETPVTGATADKEEPHRGIFDRRRAVRRPSLLQWRKWSGGKQSAPWLLWLVLAVSLIALVASILDFALIVGALPVPVPGLRAPGDNVTLDAATYNFEHGTDGWLARGAAANPVTSDLQAFAGHNSLEFQVTNLSATTKAFVYIPLPTNARQNSRIVAHVYVPAGAPPLVATIYILDKHWLWHNGLFPALTPGQWTVVSYQIPAQVQTPIPEDIPPIRDRCISIR